MTVLELTKELSLEMVVEGDTDRTIKCGFCCDLLSLVMGRAPADSAWMTVMGNVNSVAVAVLADVSCIILCENTVMDADGLSKAKEQHVTVLRTEQPIYETAVVLSRKL